MKLEGLKPDRLKPNGLNLDRAAGQILRIALASALGGLAGGLGGCLAPRPVPELDMTIADGPPPGFEEALAAKIEESLPRVSYSPDSPDYLGPLVDAPRAGRTEMDRELIEGWCGIALDESKSYLVETRLFQNLIFSWSAGSTPIVRLVTDAQALQ